MLGALTPNEIFTVVELQSPRAIRVVQAEKSLGFILFVIFVRNPCEVSP